MQYNNITMKIRTALLLIILLLAPALRAEETEEKTISGSVADLDWVGSTITLRYYPAFNTDADEINIKITRDTIMSKGTDSISLSDILQSDPVTVTYFDDRLSGLKARRVVDLNLSGT